MELQRCVYFLLLLLLLSPFPPSLPLSRLHETSILKSPPLSHKQEHQYRQEALERAAQKAREEEEAAELAAAELERERLRKESEERRAKEDAAAKRSLFDFILPFFLSL